MIPNYTLKEISKAKSDLDFILNDMRRSAEEYKRKNGKDSSTYFDRIEKLEGIFGLTIIADHLLKDTRELIETIKTGYLDADGNLLEEKNKVVLMSFMPKIDVKLKYLIHNL